MNEIVNDRLLTWLKELIVTSWDKIDWEGIPEMIPFEELKERPSGRDPSMIEKESWSPLMKGLIEINSSFDKIYEDWE